MEKLFNRKSSELNDAGYKTLWQGKAARNKFVYQG